MQKMEIGKGTCFPIRIRAMALLCLLIFASCASKPQIRISASDPSAKITVDDKDAAVGAIRIQTKGIPIKVDIDCADYDHIQTSIAPEKKAKANGTLKGISSILVGLAGAVVLWPDFIIMTYHNKDTKAQRATTRTMMRLGSIALGAAGTTGGIINFIPDTVWKPEYRIDMSTFAHYDNAGYEKATGFNRDGVNREGKFLDGSSFSGRIVNGRKTGYGIYAKPDGSMYKGTFKDGSLEGLAFVAYADGRQFVGFFDAGKENGVGVVIEPTGAQVRQVWDKGVLASQKPNPYRILSTARSWIYFGEQGSGALADGRGDAVSLDGTARIIDGLFKDGKLAQGEVVFSDGTSYKGAFEGGYLVQGRVLFPDGSSYEGSLRDGQPDGKGKMIAKDGTVYDGDFKNGTYEGEGKISRPNGERYEGSFVGGLPQGMGIYFNGETIERCEYYQGKRIDQAYQMRKENERQLAALREERERIAKEKADQAEQARLAKERAAAEAAAASQKSSDRLLGSLLVGAFAAGLSGSVGLDAGTALSLGASAATDAYKGDTSMSTTKATSQAVLDNQAKAAAAAKAASASKAGSGASTGSTASGGKTATGGGTAPSGSTAAARAGSDIKVPTAEELSKMSASEKQAFQDKLMGQVAASSSVKRGIALGRHIIKGYQSYTDNDDMQVSSQFWNADTLYTKYYGEFYTSEATDANVAKLYDEYLYAAKLAISVWETVHKKPWPGK